MAANPKLTTADGRAVPMRRFDEAYKHLGRWRCVDGSQVKARAAFGAAVRRAVRRLNRLKRATRYQFMLVSEAILAGLAGFYCQDMYLTFAEADALEASWRRALNRVARRARDTPRAELYAGGEVRDGTRRHLYAHCLTAKG